MSTVARRLLRAAAVTLSSARRRLRACATVLRGRNAGDVSSPSDSGSVSDDDEDDAAASDDDDDDQARFAATHARQISIRAHARARAHADALLRYTIWLRTLARASTRANVIDRFARMRTSS